MNDPGLQSHSYRFGNSDFKFNLDNSVLLAKLYRTGLFWVSWVSRLLLYDTRVSLTDSCITARTQTELCSYLSKTSSNDVIKLSNVSKKKRVTAEAVDMHRWTDCHTSCFVSYFRVFQMSVIPHMFGLGCITELWHALSFVWYIKLNFMLISSRHFPNRSWFLSLFKFRISNSSRTCLFLYLFSECYSR